METKMKQLLSALAALGITILAYGGGDNLKKAERLYKAGMYTEAAVLLESEKGDEAEAYKALCALAQGTDAALARAESFMGKFPESLLLPQVRFRTANYLFGKEKYEDALKHYFRISASSLSEDEQTEFLYKKGYSALKSSDLERARTFLDQCQRRERSDYTAPAQYALGYLAYSRGRFREASGWFEEAKIDPRFSQVANYYIFECRFNEKDYRWVVDHGEELYGKVPEERRSHMARLMSEAYLVLGEKEKAKSYFMQQLENKVPKTRSDYFFAGSLLYTVEDWQGAVENLNKVEERTDSIGQIAAYQLGHSYIKTRNKVAAMDAFKEASALSFNPEIREDAAYNYAKLAFDLNGDTAAFDEYMHAYNAFSKGDQIYSYMAMSALQKRDYEAAVAAYDHIDELLPSMRSNYMKAYFLRAMQLMESGAYRNAVPKLKAAAYYSSKQDPFNQLARYALAECYYRDKRFEESRAILTDLYNRSAFNGQKESALISYQMAYCYFSEADYERAQKWFENYLESPHDDFGADAETRIGDCYFFRKDYSTAIRAYERKLNDYPDPNDIYPYFRAGVACGLIRDFKSKVRFLENVKQSSPSSPYYSEAMYELGRAYVETGDDDDAVRSFRTLRSNTSDMEYSSKALLELGMIARNHGEFDTALSYYKQVVEQGGAHSEDALLAVESIYQVLRDPDSYVAYVSSLGDKASRSEEQKEQSYFSMAEQIFLAGDYKKAASTLRTYLDKYPSASHLAQAEFYLAECSRLGGDRERACDLYSKAIEDGLEGSFQETARLRFADLCYELENYPKAYVTYLSLREGAQLEANRLSARKGMMRSAFKAREYADAAAAAEDLLPLVQDGELKEVRYILAKSYLGSSRREKALPLLEQLALDPSSAEGAEAAWLLIQDQYDRAAFDGLQDRVYAFAEKAGDQRYYLAKAFIVLADCFAEQGNLAQAKQTLESIRDNYRSSGSSDDVPDQVELRLAKLK